MKKNSKKILIVLLVAAMLFVMLPTSALAGGTNLPWDLNAKPEDAIPIEANQLVEAGAFNSYAYTRWWKFTLDKPGTVTVSFSSERTTFNGSYQQYCMQIYSPPNLDENSYVGQYLFSSSGTTQTSYKYSLPKGTHYVTVKPWSTTLNVKVYKFTVNYTPDIPVTALKMNRTTATLAKPGASVQLSATATPANATNPDVTWKSSNTSVAYVSSTGWVQGLKAGTATITATAKDGSGKTATCAVTVKQPVTVLKINRTTATLAKPGATVQLTATATPTNATNKAVAWKSSNTGVATVTSTGIVRGVKAGTATVTATAKDGSGKVVTCKVTVRQPVTSLKMNKTSVVMAKPGVRVQLKAVAFPTNATNKAVTWKCSNTSVVKVTNTGLIKGLKKGTATITATAKDGSGRRATCRVVVR